jgi:hypothetical protein
MSSILTVDDEDKDHTTNKSSYLPLNEDVERPDDSRNGGGKGGGGSGGVVHAPLSSSPSREDEFAVPSQAAAQPECAVQTHVKGAEKEIAITNVELAAVEAALPLPPIQKQPNHDDGNDNTARRLYCWSLPSPPLQPEALQGALPIENWNAFWAKIMTFVRRKRACDLVVFLVVVAIFIIVERMGRESTNVVFWMVLPLALVVVVVGTTCYKWRQQDCFYEQCRELDQRLFAPHQVERVKTTTASPPLPTVLHSSIVPPSNSVAATMYGLRRKKGYTGADAWGGLDFLNVGPARLSLVSTVW